MGTSTVDHALTVRLWRDYTSGLGTPVLSAGGYALYATGVPVAEGTRG